MVDIRQAVTDKLNNSGESVKSRVIDSLVESTLKKRVQQITDAMSELDKLEKDMRRLKPDIVAYNEDSSIASQAFSKKVLDERKKISDRTEKLKRAIDKALDKNDYSDLNKVSGGGKDTSDDSGSTES